MTKHNSSDKVLGYISVKHSTDFLIASCTFGQVGKWFKIAFGILCPYPMLYFIFFFGLLSLVPCLLGLLLTGLSTSHTETSFSSLRFCSESHVPDFPSQYVLVHTLLPKGFAYQFSIHLVKNQCQTVLYVLVTSLTEIL